MSNSDDYFGGNKKRKVEPIDEDIDISANANDTPSEEKKSGNWDFLSGMFGIAAGKKKAKSDAQDAVREPAKKSSAPKADRDDAPKRKSESKRSAPAKSSAVVDDPLKALEEVADAPAEDKADLLTQIFSAGFGSSDTAEEDVEESPAAEIEADEEPKARGKRRGRGGRGRGVVVAMNKKKKSLRMIRQTTMVNPMTTLSNSKSKTSTLRLSTKRKLPIAAVPVVAAADVRKLLATILLLKRKNAQNDLARVRNLAMTLMMK